MPQTYFLRVRGIHFIPRHGRRAVDAKRPISRIDTSIVTVVAQSIAPGTPKMEQPSQDL
jgi:hypothetical protein